VIIDVPDTPENNEEFLKHTKTGRAPAPFRLSVWLALGGIGTHAIVAVNRTWSGARRLTNPLLDDRPNMLLLADRGFYSYDLWEQALQTGAALVFEFPRT